MMYLILLALVVLAWMVRGTEQAVLWSRLGDEAFKWNEHLLFLISRGLYIAILIVANSVPSMFQVLSVAGCSILLFPFFHNGTYYVARNLIADANNMTKPYPKGWRAFSRTSSAAINFSWQTRYMLAIGGGIMLLFMILSF